LKNLKFAQTASWVFCIPVKPASCGWCQCLLPHWRVAEPPWTWL
jgi:hypothetical protein